MSLQNSLPMPPPSPAAGTAAAEHGLDAPHQASAEELVASFAEADAHAVDLSSHTVEDWICLAFFWLMAGLVFLQFFTRYVLNDSYAWTEELAVYCLMPVVFIGASMCVRRARHIQVNLLYRYLPERAGRALSTLVDIAALAFYAYGAFLVARYSLMVDNEPMTTINWNKSHIYWLCFAGFALMALRALQVAVENWRRGFSALQNPGAFDGTAD